MKIVSIALFFVAGSYAFSSTDTISNQNLILHITIVHMEFRNKYYNEAPAR